MKKTDKNLPTKKHYSLTSWKIGDFILHLIVVILGIVVTMVASDIIKTNEQQQQVARALQLVKNELNDNLKAVDELENILQAENTASTYITKYKKDFSKANKDSLLNYSPTPFLSHIFNFTSDAFEMLKTLGVMQNIDNKELILKIIKTYNSLGSLKEFHNWYRVTKEKYGDRINQNEKFNHTYEIYYNTENVDKMWTIFMARNDVSSLIQFISGGTNFSNVINDTKNTLLNTINLID